MTTALSAEQAAALDAPHVVHAVDAAGAYLGLLELTGDLERVSGPAPGQHYRWDAGAWVLTPTADAVAQSVRAERNRRLAACDWVVTRATELGQAVPAACLAYRAALRAVPEQAGFPAGVVWPVPPDSSAPAD